MRLECTYFHLVQESLYYFSKGRKCVKLDLRGETDIEGAENKFLRIWDLKETNQLGNGTTYIFILHLVLVPPDTLLALVTLLTFGVLCPSYL